MGTTAKDWSEEEVALLKQLRPHMTLTDVHKEFQMKGLDRSRKALERKACNLGLLYKGDLDSAKVKDKVKEDKDLEYSVAWKKILDLKKEYKDSYEYRREGLIDPKKSTRKILCLSDFHIPFERDDLIYAAIEKHADADICVVNGDMFDMHAVSTWPKERSVILHKEYKIAQNYTDILRKRFPHVIFVKGNHEERLNRYFHSNVSKSVSFLVDKEILGRLANGDVYDDEGNVIDKLDFDNVYYDNGLESWHVQIGKTIFVHPKSYSKVEAKTSINAHEHFLERNDIDAIVVAHTHKQSFIPSRNTLCIEQGCLCCPLDYEKQGKLNYKAMVLGYCVIYQDEEGNCDFNKSHNVFLGTQYPIKKTFDEVLESINEKL